MGTSEKSPPEKKNVKIAIVVFPFVLDTFTSPFTIPSSNWKPNRRADRRSHVKLTRSLTKYCGTDIEGGGNDHFFEGEAPKSKIEKNTQEVNSLFLQYGVEEWVQKHEGKLGDGTGSRTGRSTLENIVEILEPQAVRVCLLHATGA